MLVMQTFSLCLQNNLLNSFILLFSFEFCFDKAEEDVPEKGLKKGDNIIGVHIPATTDLSAEACDAAFAQAKEFFATYFPEYEYRYFTCHSWLLDESLRNYLPKTSNILQFGNLFTKIEKDQSDAILRYLFRWDTTAENLAYAYPNTAFADTIKRAFLKGERFYETLGILKK